MTKPAIQIEKLYFGYDGSEVLRGIDLEVPAGSIFGFLGRNGSGKTTTIKLLLGLLKPQRGSCRVLGRSTIDDTLEIRREVGYMAEDQRMYGWMSVEEIVKWVASFYPRWDTSLINGLLDALELPQRSKVGTLSKGQNSRLALILALGHSPRMVMLDDPTLGLDPIARKDFLRYVIDLLQSRGITVFFSSHLLYEIEPVADYVAILHHGVIVRAGKTDDLREQVRRFALTPKSCELPSVNGVLDVTRSGSSVSVTVEAADEAVRSVLRSASANGFHESALNLDEIFEAYVIGNRGKTA